MKAVRSALIIASDTYEDRELRQLRAPGQDAQQLADVLGDPEIGNFDVRVSMNERHYLVKAALDDFFSDNSPEDVLLVHFSCHGVKDPAGRFFFATSDTRKSRLDSTAIDAEYVNVLLNRTRSRHVVLLLDCCFSGAFIKGMLPRADRGVDVLERFKDSGRGRAVLTATSELEYAWEGDDLEQLAQPSIFTSAVVKGLRTGEADRDQDQQITVDDLYQYVFDEVRRATPNQTPGKWSDVQGALVIAQSRRPGLPPELVQAIKSSFAGIREGAVADLASMLVEGNLASAHAARTALAQLTDDSSRRVSAAAARILSELAGTLVLDDALLAARAVHDEDSRNQALAALAPSVAARGRPDEALQMARVIQNEKLRAQALFAVAALLPIEQRGPVLDEALRTAQAIDDAEWRSDVLVEIASRLPVEQRGRVLDGAVGAAPAIADEDARSWALANVASELAAAGRVDEALDIARSLGDQPWSKSWALARIATWLAEVGQRPDEALLTARAIDNDKVRSHALLVVAPHLPTGQGEPVVDEVLEAARSTLDMRSRSHVLARAAALLPPDQRGLVLDEALEAARAIADAIWRSAALADIAGHLLIEQRGQVLNEALEAAWAVRDQDERGLVLAHIAARLSAAGRVDQALHIARTVQDACGRSGALVAIAPHLPPEQRRQVLAEALQATREVDSDSWRCEALVVLAPQLVMT